MKASEASKKNANGFLCISVHLLIAAASAGQVCNETVADGHTENTSGFLNHNSTDAEIAVGPDHILTCTNSWLRLHNKSGQPIAGEYVSLADFPTAQFPFFVRNNTLTSTTELIGDPVVLYDYHADRYWILADELVVGNLGLPEYSHYQFAINVSPPSIAGTSDIWMYFDEATWEYPGTGLFHLAHNQMLFADAEALYNVARWDSFDGTTGGREAETIIHIWDKASLLQGNKPTATRLLLSNEGDDTWGHCPAIEYSRWDNTHPMYLVATKEDPEHTAPPQYHHQTTIRIGARGPNMALATACATGNNATNMLIGFFLARTIYASGSQDFHYDESLQPAATAATYDVTRWLEFQSAADRATVAGLTGGYLR